MWTYSEGVFELVTNMLFMYCLPSRQRLDFTDIPTDTYILLPQSQKGTPSLASFHGPQWGKQKI